MNLESNTIHRVGCGDKIWECTIKQFLKPKVPIGFCGTPVFIDGVPYCHREYLVKTCVTYTECEHKEWVICGLLSLHNKKGRFLI
jgi:hypothetical protein